MNDKAQEVPTRRADVDVRDPIVVQASEFRKTLRLDVRHHSDEYGPTKKGVNLEFKDALVLVQAILDVVNIQNRLDDDEDSDMAAPIWELVAVEYEDDGMALGHVKRTEQIYEMTNVTGVI